MVLPIPAPVPERPRPLGGALLPRSRGGQHHPHRLLGDPSPEPRPLADHTAMPAVPAPPAAPELVGETNVGATPSGRLTDFDDLVVEALGAPPEPCEEERTRFAVSTRPGTRVRAVLQNKVVDSYVRGIAALPGPVGVLIDP